MDKGGIVKAHILIAALLFGACQQVEDARTPPGAEAPVATQPTDSNTVAVSGDFSTPESVLYDEANDVYLVSNINGKPLDKDDNGFISRVKPDGTVETLKWIDGARADIRLHAPKGMAIHGDTLFVADIDTVRAFVMSTKTELMGRGVPGATFLNDLATGPDGTLYVSDSGMTASFTPNGSDAVYRFGKTGASAVVKGTWLAQPNGLAVGSEGVTIVPNGGKAVIRLTEGGKKVDTLATMPGAGMDGLVRQDANNLFASSWETKTVYHIDVATRSVHPVVTGVESPADIGFDTKRKRILIPVFLQNRVEIRNLP